VEENKQQKEELDRVLHEALAKVTLLAKLYGTKSEKVRTYIQEQPENPEFEELAATILMLIEKDGDTLITAQELKEEGIRIRYSRPEWKSQKDRGPPRSTLLTKRAIESITEKEVLLFGISRCHSTLDIFNKKRGRDIAFRRLKKAEEDFFARGLTMDTYKDIDPLVLSNNGFRGSCYERDVEGLLRYFENLG